MKELLTDKVEHKCMGLNVVNLVGRAGGDPEVRYFDSGRVLCKLTIAVNRRSSKTDQPDWFNLGVTR